MTQICSEFDFDINGPKKPNRLGRDVFLFFITNGKGALLYPFGGMDDHYGGTNYWWNNGSDQCSTANKNGYLCTGRVMEKGWEMDY